MPKAAPIDFKSSLIATELIFDHSGCPGVRHRKANTWGGEMVRVILLLSLLVAAACCSSANDGAESWLLAGGNRAVPDCVTRHAPLVWLHSEDPFRPSDLLQHVHHTRPTVDQSPIAGLPKLSLDNLETLNRVKTGQVALTSKDDVTTLPAWILGKVPDESGRTVNATPCVVVAVERGPQDLDAFYFYFYSYNRGANLTQVMEPVNRLIQDVEHGMHFGDHVGDWEHNMIRFRDGQPTGIYYSQHSGGAAYGWHDEGISLEDERPVVFSAYGSHANYPSPGNHIHDEALIDYCDAGKLWDPVLSAYFYHYHPATSTFTRLLPAGSAVPPTGNLGSFLHYTGLWGDARYPDDHPLQRTVPLFGLKRFVSGPLGPMAKQLVRGGLSPDSRGSKSWTQRLVGILMSWYPCCLRGWRKWLSGAVVAALLVLSMMGLGHGVKRYRARKGYKKMEADIPLGDIDPPGRVAWRGDGEA